MTNELDMRERELVALGAAMGSNCIGCIEHHVPAARQAGLTEAQLSEALRIADQVRQVPARKVLEVAVRLLSAPPAPTPGDGSGKPAVGPEASRAARCCG